MTYPLLLAGHDANFLETFALPLQCAALYSFGRARPPGSGYRWWYALGVTGAAGFLLRQTLVGIWLAIGVATLVSAVRPGGTRRLLVTSTLVGLGVASVVVPVGAYLLVNGAWG